jgi:hypothetical protein
MGQWEKIVGVYGTFGLLVAITLVFFGARLPESSKRAIAFTYIGALTFLPAAAYDVVHEEEVIPTWILGALLPTPWHGLNKAWIAAFAALAVGLRLEWRRFASFRPSLIDLPLVLFCLLPFLQMFVVKETPEPSAYRTFLQLAACWGLPWLVGRVWLNDRAGLAALADALVVFTLLLLPIAVFEGLFPQHVHAIIYGPHHFARDGVVRAIGFRPIAFFEHGTQYGIWVGCAAFAGWWRARHQRQRGGRHTLRWLAAIILILMTLAAQSLDATVMLTLAIVWLEIAPLIDRFPWLWRTGMVGLTYFVATFLNQLYVGKQTGQEAPLLRILTAQITPERAQSLRWRVDRAIENLGTFNDHFVFGYATALWSKGFRPWDMVLMLIGQFGLVGLGLVTLSIVSALTLRSRTLAGGLGSSRHLALGLVGMALVDSLMNCFVFYPALVLLGALATSPVRRPSVRLPEAEWLVEGREPNWLTSAPAATSPGQKM